MGPRDLDTAADQSIDRRRLAVVLGQERPRLRTVGDEEEDIRTTGGAHLQFLSWVGSFGSFCDSICNKRIHRLGASE